MSGYVYNDGGRSAAGYKGETGDCVCRSIAIATGKPYKEVYDELSAMMKAANKKANLRGKNTPRDGVSKKITRDYLESLGWQWIATMKIGQGCKTHLRADELPAGRLVVSVSKHITAVIDGVIHDTYDPSRSGMRCVYGYFLKGVS